MDGDSIARLSAVAGGQSGVFTRADARRAGLTKGRLRHLIECGTAERIAPSVLRFVAATHTWRQQVLAAVLDGGEECLASHRTAAALHRFDGFPPNVIEVLVPMRIRHIRKDVLVHHTRSLTDSDRGLVGVIPVTSPSRTLIDLGAVASASVVEEVFDGAERDRAVRRGEVERRYRALRVRGRNGVGAMTQILDGRLAVERVPRSVLERRMLSLLRRAGLQTPQPGFRVRGHDGRAYTLDFAYVNEFLGLELDGHGSHATRRERLSDNARASALGDVGWRLRRFTYEQVMHDPAAVATTVRNALGGTLPPPPNLSSELETRRGTTRTKF